MDSKYWSGVGEKLKLLGKTVFDMAAPVAVDFAIVKAVEKACSVVELKLKEMYRRTAFNSLISFIINLLGVLILIFKPFGGTVSRYAAYGFFAASFIFWLARTIIFIKNYGKTAAEVTKTVLQQKSLYSGIEKYVLANFPLISLGYAGVSIAAEYVPSLKHVPKISEFVSYLVKIFWKRVVLFAGIMTFYTVLVFGLVKPMLIKLYF